MEEDTELERGPFGVTVDGVTSLVPEVRLWNSDDPLPTGTYKITATQVVAWLEELTDAVSIATDGWERLSVTPTLDVDGTTVLIESDRDRFIGTARTIVHNGAASYLEAARRPESAARTESSYADVLWNRYETGLTRLVAWLTLRLDVPEPGDTDPDAGALAYAFPCPTFPDNFAV